MKKEGANESRHPEELAAENVRQKYVQEVLAGATENLMREATESEVRDPATGFYKLDEFRRLAIVEATTLARRNRKESKEGSSLFILSFDLDLLKPINDTYGHEAGNRAILAVAKHLQKKFRRSEDILSHPHGDEFWAAVGSDSVQEIYDRLGIDGEAQEHGVIRIKVPGIDPGNDDYEVTVSMGVAHYAQEEGEEAKTALQQAMREAELKMYKAKGDKAR